MNEFTPPVFQPPPSLMDVLNRRFSEIEELNRELAHTIFELTATTQAQGAAIQALISASPDLDKVHESLLASMDLTADYIGPKHINLFQERLSHIQAQILAEQARRRAA